MVIVVGSINIDQVFTMPRFPAAGETLLGADFQSLVGGKGANQAVAAARAGAGTTLIGAVGVDSLGLQAVDFLSAENLNLKIVNIDEGVHTGVAAIWVAENGENSICVIPGVNHSFKAVHLPDPPVFADNLLLLQGEIPARTSIEAARRAKQAGARVLLNLAPVIPFDLVAYEFVDVLIVNECEAEEALRMSVNTVARDPEAAAILLGEVVSTVIITLGEAGVVYCHAGEIRRHPAFTVSALDTTGAGDAFVGNLAAMLDKGKPMDEAIEWASAAAALAVTVLGGTPSLPHARQTAAFLRSRGNRVNGIANEK